MAEFAALNSYSAFQRSVRWQNRYVHDEQTVEFLKAVVETSKSRIKKIPKGTVLFRAQRGFDWRTESAEGGGEYEVETAFGPDRMVPKAKRVGDGRANAARIPCLYLASTKSTAMAEVRPWVQSRVSLAEFMLMRDCAIVDCSADRKRSVDFIWDEVVDASTPSVRTAVEKETGVWGDIGHAFSEPMNADDSNSDYIPTQVLAEVLRAQKYDGIVYRSALEEKGHNIALFDLSSAELINCCLYQTKNVRFEFEQVENPYFVRKHYPQLLESKTKKDG